MPRNKSEQGPSLPASFPLPNAPKQHLPPKFHARIFWLSGVQWLPNGDDYANADVNYQRMCASFTPEETTAYNNVAFADLLGFYARWWKRFIDEKANHAA